MRTGAQCGQETAMDKSPIFSEPKFGQESSSDKRPLRTRVRLTLEFEQGILTTSEFITRLQVIRHNFN